MIETPTDVMDRIERTVSTSNQTHHFVATAVWDWPLGKTILNTSAYERAILSGYCVGCAASSITLKQGLQLRLRETVPEVRSVEAV